MSDKCHTDKHRKRREKEIRNKRVRVIRDREREQLWQQRAAQARQEHAEAVRRAQLEDPRRPYVQKLVNILYARVASDPVYRLSRMLHAIDDAMGPNIPVYYSDRPLGRKSLWGPNILP